MKNKLFYFNDWLNEEYLNSIDAENYALNKGLDLKKIQNASELANAGEIEKTLIDVVSEIEKLSGIELLITAGNDLFHKKFKNSYHNQGNAIDFVFKNTNENTPENRKKIEEIIINLIKSGKYNIDGKILGAINEYDRPSRHSTGGHFHLSLAKNNKEHNLILSGIKSYNDIISYEQNKQIDNYSIMDTNFNYDDFKYYSKIYLKPLRAVYEPFDNSFILYKRNGNELGKVKYENNKIIIFDNNNKKDITDTKDGEIFKKAFEYINRKTPNEIIKILNGEKLLKQGSIGEDVRLIQKRLVELGYLNSATGVFDSSTKNAVMNFQKDVNIKVDGIVGPITSSKLYGIKIDEYIDMNNKNSTLGIINKSTTDYDKIVLEVIDRLEGGYFHPDMLKDGRVKDQRYVNSGETMMGIDRSSGKKINDSPEAKEFWKLIDDAGARYSWKWNYKGGPLEPKLKELAGKIIKPYFEKFSNLYLSPKAKQLVYSDGRLLFHFIYATWNGSGWFKKFASDINNAVDAGITNTDELLKIAIDSRIKEGLKPGSPPNSLIAQGGEKIKKIVGIS